MPKFQVGDLVQYRDHLPKADVVKVLSIDEQGFYIVKFKEENEIDGFEVGQLAKVVEVNGKYFVELV